ncbi:MAG: hypothetical protein O3A92_08890 [Verrucomicrobia bacterium]|nr:hypothetical protein [Verrucomicrobiota bacterium]
MDLGGEEKVPGALSHGSGSDEMAVHLRNCLATLILEEYCR